MAWIAVIVLVAAFLAFGLMVASGRRFDTRRKDRLELAFYRARSQRMVSNGIRNARF